MTSSPSGSRGPGCGGSTRRRAATRCTPSSWHAPPAPRRVPAAAGRPLPVPVTAPRAPAPARARPAVRDDRAPRLRVRPAAADALDPRSAPSRTIPSRPSIPALEAGIVDVDGDTLRFRHPLLGETVYELASPATRRRIHAGWRTSTTTSRNRLGTWPWGPTRPMPRSPRGSRRRRVWRSSAAARRPPPISRPMRSACPPTTRSIRDPRRRRRLAEAEYAFAAGDSGRASAILDAVLADLSPGPERARLLARRARLHHFEDDIGTSVRVLRAALEEAGDDDRLRASIEEGLAWGQVMMRIRPAGGGGRMAHRPRDWPSGSATRPGRPRGWPPRPSRGASPANHGATPMERALALEPATLGLPGPAPAELRLRLHPRLHGCVRGGAGRVRRPRGARRPAGRRERDPLDPQPSGPPRPSRWAAGTRPSGRSTMARSGPREWPATVAGGPPREARAARGVARRPRRRRSAAAESLRIARGGHADRLLARRPRVAWRRRGDVGARSCRARRGHQTPRRSAGWGRCARRWSRPAWPSPARCPGSSMRSRRSWPPTACPEAEAGRRAPHVAGQRVDRVSALAAAARGRALVLGASGDAIGERAAFDEALERIDALPLPLEQARTRLGLGSHHGDATPGARRASC